MPFQAEPDPLTVDTFDGEVVMTGPRVAVALTATAAAETARRLAHAASVADAYFREPSPALQRANDER